MREIKAYVRNVKVDEVIDALSKLDAVSGVAVVSLRAYGHSAGNGGLKRVEMTKLEVDIADDAEQAVVDCIVEYGRTGAGHPGDGRVFVTQLERAVRIADGTEDDGRVSTQGSGTRDG